MTNKTLHQKPGQRAIPLAHQLVLKTRKTIDGWIDVHLPILLRLSLGIIYLWFGALKFVPGRSPAEMLVLETINEISELIPLLSLPPQPLIWFLALSETVIGLGLIIGRKPRIFLTLLTLQMIGAALPLLLLPHLIWVTFPLGLTLEGQFITKNLVIVTSAMAYSKTIADTPNQIQAVTSKSLTRQPTPSTMI